MSYSFNNGVDIGDGFKVSQDSINDFDLDF